MARPELKLSFTSSSSSQNSMDELFQGDFNKLTFPNISESFDFKIEDFTNLDIIESTRHIVQKGYYKPTNKWVAIKYVLFPQSVYQDDDIQRKLTHLKREIQTFRVLSTSPNIVDFYRLCLSDGHLLMCMELMDITLRKFYKIVHSKLVETTTPVFPEKILGFITVKVLYALAYCKKLNITHRDVKPDNILLNLNGSIKLCDFGESRYLENSFATTNVGTIAYLPPERFHSYYTHTIIPNSQIAQKSGYGVRSDIWSVGITLAETANGNLPYWKLTESGNRVNEFELESIIVHVDGREITQRSLTDGYSEDIVHFVNMCLEKVENRPKYDELMSTNFYKYHEENFNLQEMADFIANYQEKIKFMIGSIYNSLKESIYNSLNKKSKKTIKHRQITHENYSQVKYVTFDCPLNCGCSDQKDALLKALSNKNNISSTFISTDIVPQIISWASTHYKNEPCYRSACKIFADSDHLYLFGGANPNISSIALQDAWKFNLLSRKWTKMQLSGDVPKSLIDFAGETIYDKSDISGYVFGGAEDFEACKLSNKLYSFKIEEDEINFTEIKALDSKLPSARSGSSLSTRQAKKLFVIGGMDEMAYNLDIWIANVDQNQVKWENIAINGSNPEGRYTHKTVLLGNKHVLLGGGNAMWSASFDYLTTFDPVAKEFILIETKPDQTHGFPIARKFHAVDQYENEVYLIGGCKAISTESKEHNSDVLGDIWRLNLETMQWDKWNSELAVPVFFHAAAVTPVRHL